VFVKKVRKKLEEYGLIIYSNYKLEESKGNEYVFIIEEAIILVRKNEKTIGISFQVTTKPDRAATLTLIIGELESKIIIMEGFIFNRDSEFVSGEKAYNVVNEAKKETAKKEVEKEHFYNLILQKEKGFEC